MDYPYPAVVCRHNGTPKEWGVALKQRPRTYDPPKKGLCFQWQVLVALESGERKWISANSVFVDRGQYG